MCFRTSRYFILLLPLLTAGCLLFSDQEIVIGEFASTTGSEASFGVSSGRGVQMAVDEANAGGGLHGRKVKLITRDTESSRERTIDVVTRLIRKDDVVALIGEVASDRSMAAAPLAQAANIPMISPASTNPGVTDVGNFIFRSCYIDPFQGFAMAKFASSDLHLKRVAIFSNHRSNYSSGLAEYFKETFENLGGKIVFEDTYSPEDNDYTSTLKRIRAAKPQAIFLPGYFAEVRAIAEQMHRLGMKVVLLGGDGWDSKDLLDAGFKTLEGAYYTNHFTHEDKNPIAAEFVQKYKALYNELPDGVAAMGYDAAKILLAAIDRTEKVTPKNIRDSLAKTKDHAGVTGNISFSKDRDPVKPIVVLKIVGHQAKFVRRIEPQAE